MTGTDQPNAAQRIRLARAGITLGTPTVLAAATCVWTLSQPPVYRADCVLEYGRDLASAGAGGGPSSDEWYRTQDFLIGSSAVLERVVAQAVRTTGAEKASGRAGAATAQPDIASLRQQLDVTPIPETRLVRVSVEDRDAARATSLVNAVAEAYLRKSMEDRVSSTRQTAGWLNDQVEATTQRLANAERELQTYVHRNEQSALPLPEQQEILASEIKELHQRLTEVRLARIELDARAAKLKTAVQADDPFDVHTAEVDDDEYVKQLRSEYGATIVRQREMETTQGPSSQGALLAQAKAEALREQMRKAVSGIVARVHSDLSAAQNIEMQMRGALDKTNAAARRLQLQQLEYGKLERARSEAETLLRALDAQAAGESAPGVAALLNARVVDTASVARPVEPPVLRNALLAALLGVPLGLLLSIAPRRLRRAALGSQANDARESDQREELAPLKERAPES